MRVEYGVRSYGGHIEAKVSRHVAVNEVVERQAAGEKNVWLVARDVSDWLAAPIAGQHADIDTDRPD